MCAFLAMRHFSIIDSTLQIFVKDQNETPNKFGFTHSNRNGHSDSSSALDGSAEVSISARGSTVLDGNSSLFMVMVGRLVDVQCALGPI